MLWYLITALADEHFQTRTYQNYLQCEKDLADRLVERRSHANGLILWETCSTKNNADAPPAK